MKKSLLLLSVFAIIFTSCNNDDDSPPPTIDPIIGIWTYHKSFINDVEQILTDCETEATLNFNSNGSYSYAFYEVTSGVCQLEESLSGTWTNAQDGMYTITLEGEATTGPVTFENNTFFIVTTEINQGLAIVYKEVYIKQ